MFALGVGAGGRCARAPASARRTSQSPGSGRSRWRRQRRRRAEPIAGRSERARRDRLHVRHLRAAEGRDADAREPAVRRATCPRGCASSVRPTACTARCRSTTSTGSPRCCSARSARARACRSFARFDAARALDALAHDGLTMFQGVPAMYARMLERLPRGHARGRAARCAISTRAVRRSIRRSRRRSRQRFGLPLHNGYGLTECSPTVSQTRLDCAARRHVGRSADPRHRGSHRRFGAARRRRRATSASCGSAART